MDPVLVAMMTQCWAEQPSDRPSFEELTKQMRKLNDGKLVINFNDTMFILYSPTPTLLSYI
jgi:hypothetical protein